MEGNIMKTVVTSWKRFAARNGSKSLSSSEDQGKDNSSGEHGKNNLSAEHGKVNRVSTCSEVTETTPMEVDLPEDTSFKLTGIRIEENIICQIDITKGSVQVKASKKQLEKRVPVLILDCSGSMGDMVQRSVTAWQRTLRALKYKDDTEVHIIEFESRTTMSHHKLSDLDGLGMRSRGGTSMGGVVKKLVEILTQYKDSNINIWVISDGQIGDQSFFKRTMTEELSASFSSPNIGVVGVRLCSRHSDPDVQAMSAVGLLSNQNFKLEDLQIDNYNEDITSGLVELLGGMMSTEEAVTVTSEQSRLVLRPGEEEKSSLDIWNGDYFMVMGGKEDEVVMVNGKPTVIEIQPEDSNLGFLDMFATKVYSRLVQEKVAGLYDNTKFIEALEQLFNDLDNMTKKVESVQEIKTKEMKTTSRGKQMLDRYVKEVKTIRLKIAQLKNMGNLEHLSGNMMSDLMRNLGSGKADVGLMRRYAKTDQAKNPSSIMDVAMTKCKEALDPLKKEKEQKNPEKCFFSQESSLEGAIAAIDIGFAVYESSNQAISADELLTIFGLNGIAIQHKYGNYTDPMLIGLNQGLKDTILEVYTNIVLNQSVVWYAKMNKTQLKAPGFDKTITAVVPIKSWNHPAVWKLYCQDTDIAALQTSAHLRNVLTPLPKDRVAFTASLLLKMMSDWENPSEIQGKMMCETLLSIQWKNQNDYAKMLAKALRGDNPLAELSTANNLASELAPFSQLLCDSTLLTFMGTKESRALWKAIISNTIYWTVRRAIGDQDREELIKKLIDYKDANFTRVLPDDVDEPDHVVIHDQLDEGETIDLMKGLKFLYDDKLYRIFLSLARSFKINDGKATPEIFKSPPANKDVMEEFVGMNFDLFCIVEVFKSVMTKSETDRYGDESIGFHDTGEAARKFLRGKVKWHYRRQYETKLKLKQERVRGKRHHAFLANFPGMPWDRFTKELNKIIPNLSTTGSLQMIKNLQKDKDTTVDLEKKAVLLLVGREGEVVWNNGAVNRRDKHILLEILEKIIPSERFSMIEEHVTLHSWHRYREDPPNRQGHCNMAPSFWAVTDWVEPWGFLKNDPNGYRKFLEKLKTMSGSDEAERIFYDTWKHLLELDPHKHDVYAGKDFMSGKQKKKMRKVQNKLMYAQRKKSQME